MSRPTDADNQKTLHDEFIMAALTGLLANPNVININGYQPDSVINEAIMYANLVMEARKK